MPSNATEMAAFRQAFNRTYDWFALRPYQFPEYPKLAPVFDIVQTRFTPVNDSAEVEGWFHATSKPAADGGEAVMYLRPSPEALHVLPMLSLAFDFSSEVARVRLQLGMCRLARPDLNESGNLVWGAMRFESPESPDKFGLHGFYHAQSMRNFAGRDLPIAAMVDESTPAVPLDAANGVMLLVCALVSLYGETPLLTFHREAGGYFSGDVEAMHMWINRPRYYSYLRGKEERLACTRSRELQRIQTEVGAQLVACSSERFFSADASLREFLS